MDVAGNGNGTGEAGGAKPPAPPSPPRLTLKQRAFLKAYSQLGQIASAAKAAKVNRITHYEWLAGNPTYRGAFEAAREDVADKLEREAFRRAHNGVDEPVFYEGEAVGKIRKYSDVLLIFLLKGLRPEKFRERYEHTGAGGKPLNPDHITHTHKMDLSVFSDDELDQYNALVSKLASRGGAGTLPGAN